MLIEDKCKHCGLDSLEHQNEHANLCCECFDLSCGMPLDQLNEERKRDGKPPIENPWPGLDEKGNRI